MNAFDPAVIIARISLFASLSQPELELLVSALKIGDFTSGSVLMKEGQSDDLLYILLDGEAEVIKALGTADERLLGVKGRGSLFGEMSLFDRDKRHTASVRARTDVSVMEMTLLEFDALLHRYPKIAYEMVRQLSLRLDDSENITILDLRLKNLELTRAYQELQDAQEQLILKEKMEQELAIARQIQEGQLPDTVPSLSGFDVAALTVPARAVGGDYYDFIPMGDDRFGLVVGDACDKGIPAALFITLANSLVHVEAPRNPSPEATLRMVNQHLIGMSRAGMFVTMLYGILKANGEFDYCRAGHPHPFVLDADFHQIPTHSGVGMPLGIFEEIQLDSHSLIIPPGGAAVIFSDGLSEIENSEGTPFGIEKLADVLPGIILQPAERVCSELWRLVQEFAGENPQYDDFTVIVIKRGKL